MQQCGDSPELQQDGHLPWCAPARAEGPRARPRGVAAAVAQEPGVSQEGLADRSGY